MPTPELAAQLAALADHVRDPAKHAGPPGIEPRRLRVYADLVFNNLRGLLAGNLPVLRRCLGEGEFDALVRDFLKHHRSRTPLFPELAREFIAFLDTHPTPPRPWAGELAQYEYAEVALELHDATLPRADPQGNLLALPPVLSPLAWPLIYRWPVHRLGPANQPVTPPASPTCLLLQRDAASGKVRFRELSPLAFRLMQRLDEHPADRGEQHLLALAKEAGTADIDAFRAAGQAMLEDWRMRGIVLGAKM